MCKMGLPNLITLIALALLSACVTSVPKVDNEVHPSGETAKFKGLIYYRGGSYSADKLGFNRKYYKYINGRRGCVNVLVPQPKDEIFNKAMAKAKVYHLLVEIEGRFVSYGEIVSNFLIESQSSTFRNDCGNDYFFITK